MKKLIFLLVLALFSAVWAEAKPAEKYEDLVVRIAEIEVYPKWYNC